MKSRFFASASAADTPRSAVSRSSCVTTPEEFSQTTHESLVEARKRSRYFVKAKKLRFDAPEDTKENLVVNDDEPNCAICLGKVSRTMGAVINSCSHEFCFECIGEWANVSNKCPLCKGTFTRISSSGQVRIVQSPTKTNENEAEDDGEDDEGSGARYYSSGEETDLSGFLVPDDLGLDENYDDINETDPVETSGTTHRFDSRAQIPRRRRLVLSSSEDDSNSDDDISD